MRAQVISFHCVLTNRLGQLLGSSFNQDVINQRLAGDDQLEGLIAGLQDLKAGEKRQIVVPADRAYGAYDPKLVIEVARSELSSSENLGVGTQVLTSGKANHETQSFRVVSCKKDTVVLDGNHPLAGQDLVFNIEVTAARDAIDEDFEEPTYSPLPSHLLH